MSVQHQYSVHIDENKELYQFSKVRRYVLYIHNYICMCAIVMLLLNTVIHIYIPDTSNPTDYDKTLLLKVAEVYNKDIRD